VVLGKSLEHSYKCKDMLMLCAMFRKSHIAIEYCQRFRVKNPGGSVFWVDGSTAAGFNQAYNSIARKLNLPGHEGPKVDTLRLVYEWLSDEDHGAWLMVLDNADDIEVIFSAKPTSSPLFNYLPRSLKGSIIITTRDARLGERLADMEKPIVVPPLAIQEAERLLRSKLPQDYELGDIDAVDLLNTLGCLPLAITQAAAFISENSITPAEYIEAFQANDSITTYPY
jgi:hypothetical protein